MRISLVLSLAAACVSSPLVAQFGGSGADGVLRPTADITLDTTNRPGGWSYTVIDVPAGVTVTLIGPHPAILRSQSTVRVAGAVKADGGLPTDTRAGLGGPGGFAGGWGGPGRGPNGGRAGGLTWGGSVAAGAGGHQFPGHRSVGAPYGTDWPFDLRGGSGGGGTSSRYAGASWVTGGGGGGGVIVLLADGDVSIQGQVTADGASVGLGHPFSFGDASCGGGGGVFVRSGGDLRVTGEVSAAQGQDNLASTTGTGDGFVRLDSYGTPPTLAPGAAVEPAPREVLLPAIAATAPVVGQSWFLRAESIPNDDVVFLFSTATASIPVPGLGLLELDPAAGVFVLGQVRVGVQGVEPTADLRIQIPADSSLRGVTAAVQALTVRTWSVEGPRFSQLIRQTIR